MARGMVKFRNGLCSVSTFISSVNFPTDPKFFMWKPCEKHLKHLRKIRSLPESFFTSVSSCSWSLRIKRLTFMHALLSLTKPNRKFLTQTGDLRNTDGARKKLTARASLWSNVIMQFIWWFWKLLWLSDIRESFTHKKDILFVIVSNFSDNSVCVRRSFKCIIRQS